MKHSEIKTQIMNHYNELKKGNDLVSKYPELSLSDDKIHVLFPQCLLTREGFYRTYLQYLLLNDSESHTAIISSIQKRDFTKQFEDYDLFLSTELIEWADVIVFPALLFDCRAIFSEILKINPKINFVMDINTLHIGNDGKHLNQQLIKNLKSINSITCSSAYLKEKYTTAFQKSYGNQDKQFIGLPSFLISSYLVKRSDDVLDQMSTVNIGFMEEYINQNVLEQIKKSADTLDKSVSVSIYGDGKTTIPEISGLTISQIKTVRFLDFYKTILDLNLDFMVLTKNSNGTKDLDELFQYGEPALLSIPLICHSSNSCTKFIKPNINGFIYRSNEELQTILNSLIANKDKAHKVGQAAQGMALKLLSWNAERAKQLISIYHR